MSLDKGCGIVQSIKRKNIFKIFTAVLVILIGIIAEKTGSNHYLIIALAVVIIYSVLCNSSQLFEFALLLVASNRILTIGFISLPAVVMIIGCIRLVINGKIKMKNSFVIGSIFLILESFVTCINGSSQIFSTLKIIIVLYFIQSYTDITDIKKTYVQLVDACATGCIITSVLTVFLNYSSLYNNYRFSLTQSGGENVLGILCSIMILNLLYIILYKTTKNRTRYIIYVGLLGVISLLTGSRSALLSLLIGVFGIFIISCLRQNMKQVAVMIVFGFIIFMIACFLFKGDNLITIYVDRFIYRMQKLGNADISNGRFALWKIYFNVFCEYPAIFLFGGMDYIKFGIEMVAHNMIIEQVAAYGIIGSSILIMLYLNVYRNIKDKSCSRVIPFSIGGIPLVSFFIVSMFSHTLIGIPQTIMLYISAYGILEEKD